MDNCREMAELSEPVQCDDTSSFDVELIEEVRHFFSHLSTSDDHERCQALDKLSANLLDLAISGSDVGEFNGHIGSGPKYVDKRTQSYLLTAMRYRQTCPYKDVRDKMSSLLHLLQKEHNIPIPRQLTEGATCFIPNTEFKQTGNHNDDQVQQMYIEQFMQSSRLDHVTQVIGLHPKYLNAFQRTHNFMLRGDGPLSYDYRHYIAIMAAARHRCAYVVRLQEKEFLCQGGDPDWLESINNIPQKLKDLYEVIKILAHQPWLITKEHIEKLLKGKDSWSLSELVHAIVIMAHFSALASFVFGCGINQEVDMEGGYTVQPPSIADTNNESTDDTSNNSISNDTQDPESSVDELVSRMEKLKEQDGEESSQEEKVKKFENIGKQNVDLPQPSKELCMTKIDVTQYVMDTEFTYKDFVKRGEVGTNTTFRAQDYAWEDHGYSLVNRLYPDIGPLLDEKFSIAKDLTYNTMGNKQEVDTFLLRQVIWIYIHSLFGIRHDDYDYACVNQLMERSLKTYIKIVTCYPERTTKKDYDNFWRVFKHSEKVHVNIMILEARMQAGLLYSLRAIMQYMT